jgi:hypothetical protein
VSVVYPVRLRSIEDYIRLAHGSARSLSAAEILVIDQHAIGMIDDIQDAWPVDTSTSRDAWDYDVEESPGSIVLMISNPLFYAQYVHYAGSPADPPLWETLIPAVVQRAAPALLADLRVAIAETERLVRQGAVANNSRGFIEILSRRPGLFGGVNVATG